MEAKVEEKNTPCEKNEPKSERSTSDITIVEVVKTISSKFVDAEKKIEEISSICTRIASGR